MSPTTPDIVVIGTGMGGATAAWAPHPISRRAVDFYALSEDLPDPDSRVRLDGRKIVLDWQRTNMTARNGLARHLRQCLRTAVNPALTVAALALGTADHIKRGNLRHQSSSQDHPTASGGLSCLTTLSPEAGLRDAYSHRAFRRIQT